MKNICLAVVLVLAPFAFVAAQQNEIIEEVIVKINDDIITLSEFSERFEIAEDQLAMQFQGEDLEKATAEFRKRLFNVLVNVKLMEQRAKKLGLRMDEQYFQRTVQYFKQQSGSQTDVEFQKALADNGMTMDDVRKLAERQYLQGALFRREVLFKEEENLESKVQEYYERNATRYRTNESYRLSQIVFPYTATTEQDVTAVATAVLERIRGGEDFGVVYREVTPQAAPEAGGDIGTVAPASLREELRTAVVGKNVGDVADLVRLPNALVLLKVTEKQEARLLPLEEIQQQVMNDMQNERVAQGLEELIMRYKDESFIEVKSDEFHALYDPKSTRREL